MAEKVISKERLDYTVDLLVAMAVEETAEESGREPKAVLAGPTYIADMYMQECKNNPISR